MQLLLDLETKITWDDGHEHSGFTSMDIGKDGGFFCDVCNTEISSRWCNWGKHIMHRWGAYYWFDIREITDYAEMI